MSLEQDQPCIDRTLKGDMGAFTVLVDRYKHMVYTLAMRMVKNREEAEEIAQDTFLKAYKGLENFKGESKFSTWIYKIAYHCSLDHIKKMGRKPITTDMEGFLENTAPVGENLMTQLERDERKTLIKDALEQLPGDDGILITLHYYEELSINEISNIMDITVSNVKVKLFRARKRLEQILTNILEPEIIGNYGKK